MSCAGCHRSVAWACPANPRPRSGVWIRSTTTTTTSRPTSSVPTRVAPAGVPESAAQRQLSAKADAQMLLGSARLIDGLARIGKPSRLVLHWTTRGLGLIRGAEDSEDQIRETIESMRQAGRSAEANLLPHTTALENRTTRLQQGVESRYDALRVILNRAYREEFGIPASSSQESVTAEKGQPSLEPPSMVENQKTNAGRQDRSPSPRRLVRHRRSRPAYAIRVSMNAWSMPRRRFARGRSRMPSRSWTISLSMSMRTRAPVGSGVQQHESGSDYEKSLQYQRAWLGMSSWVGRACPRVC